LAAPIYFDEPPIAKRLFGSTTFAWLWLVLRLYLGWEWFVSGWGKTFGGNLTWKFWQWGESPYSLTGTANCGWIRSCVVNGQSVSRGSSLQGFAASAVKNSQGPIPTSLTRGTSTFSSGSETTATGGSALWSRSLN
jgi:thiosulfate dehydrogenase (quinone) large subunit